MTSTAITETKIIKSLTEQSVIYYYIFFFVATNFINKYVLSVLRFTYPTIFQGWQVTAGGFILWCLTLWGHVTLNTHEYHRSNLILWSPAMILYTISIYSGSVSLANLPIPMFFCVRTIITVASYITDYCLCRKSMQQLVLLPLLLSFVIAAVYTDPQYNHRAYGWVASNIIIVVLYEVYVKTVGSRVTLGSVDKVFCNYLCGITLLAPSSVLLGDLVAAKHFQFFYFYKFYMGCFASGIFGVILILQGIKLNQSEGDQPSKEFLSSFSKIVASFLSLLLFTMTLSATNMLCIAFTLGTELLMIEHFGRSSLPSNSHSESPHKNIVASDGSKQKTNNYSHSTVDLSTESHTLSI